MDRSPRFGSISSDNCPMNTLFCYGSAFRLLRLAARRLYCSLTTPFSRFMLLPLRSPLLRESLLLSFPLATKMFQFARLSLACPWIQQESMLIFNSLKHFVDYYALPRLWVPRYPLSNRRITKIGCYHKALYRLSSRVRDKRTRTTDIRRRVNHRLSGPPTDSTIEANDRQ
ncbi:hypothetical protein R3W88_007954 [Solanum pinnatisectum]|uniref:Uncharacterized protein n=1 Tax=Solanum pinnatisectum TaxID=50273 RepID=A0AAV9M798_9SOLN|nr:hypothetical protein R3W88_007954 [Solanum pinnatisectum]